MPELRYELMRPEQVVAARARAPVAYVPMGPLEWHGPHLPLGVDMLHAHAMALRAARRTGGVVLPPLPLGTETYLDTARLHASGLPRDARVLGMDYPGFPVPSLYVDESTLGVIIRGIIRALSRQAFRVIAIVNGHGAPNHLTLLSRTATEESVPGKLAVLVTGYRHDTSYRGHAERHETSFVLVEHPETVDLAALPRLPRAISSAEFGILDELTCRGDPAPDFTVRSEQDPRAASAALGEQDLGEEAERIARKVWAALGVDAPSA